MSWHGVLGSHSLGTKVDIHFLKCAFHCVYVADRKVGDRLGHMNGELKERKQGSRDGR